MDSDYSFKDLPGFKVFKAQDPYNPDILVYEYIQYWFFSMQQRMHDMELP